MPVPSPRPMQDSESEAPAALGAVMLDGDARRALLLDKALAEGRMTAAFQPVIDARMAPRVAFHELLARIRTPLGALIPAAQFLPHTTSSASMAALDLGSLTRALEHLAYMPEARLSVNVGAASLDNPEWMGRLRSAVRRAPDVGYRLIVEITEAGEVIDNPAMPDFMGSLRRMGISVALDDFGSGATGFHLLREHRFDIVKIDGRYGDGLDSDPDAQVLVRALLDIARHFEMLTVIEFIDRPQDAERATALGVDCLQGYLFGRPAESLQAPPDDAAFG